MVYRFEEVQKLKFSVYDIDNVSPTLDDDAFLGSIECTLGEVGVVNWWCWARLTCALTTMTSCRS